MNDWIYVNDDTNENRYILGRKGERVLFCLGINPSYAEPPPKGRLDPTIMKVQSISRRNEFDGWVMINVYLKRGTKFIDLPVNEDEEANKENLKSIS